MTTLPAIQVAPAPAALVLYGRVGRYDVRTASMKAYELADVRLWRNCADSIYTRVLVPWRRTAPVDVFVQSWNLELSTLMNAFWRPAASFHAAQNETMPPCSGLKYCERSQWALLGMKHALALRSRWVASPAGNGRVHATVLVMRHDLIFHTEIPRVRCDRGVQLWLPLNCQHTQCRERRSTSARGDDSKPPSLEHCMDFGTRHVSNWTLVTTPTKVLGRRCGDDGHDLNWCEHSVTIDWWFAASPGVADGFGDTFDNFSAYSTLIKRSLRFHNSAPHHYWGLYFFHTMKLREQCQLGHLLSVGLDFNLGRMLKVPEGLMPSAPRCIFDGWNNWWLPPTAAGNADSSISCNASAIPGYDSQCPAPSAQPVMRTCYEAPGKPVLPPGSAAQWPTAASEADERRRSAAHVLLGGQKNWSGALLTQRRVHRQDRSRLSHSNTTSPRATQGGRALPELHLRDKLLDLQATQAAGLVTYAEYELLRKRALEQFASSNSS